jgi:L-asparaginase
VINVEGILNPIDLCLALQNERDRVLSGAGALKRARSLGLEEGDVRTKAAIAAWESAIDGQTGTVGAVVLDIRGQIAAATSTGGRGMEGVGRVSDSATVAGNFATHMAGVSCTGIGEDIVDGALAVRLVTAVESGVPLNAATDILRSKMRQHQWKAGLIALDKDGQWSTLHTTDVMYWHAVDHRGHHQFERVDRP